MKKLWIVVIVLIIIMIVVLVNGVQEKKVADTSPLYIEPVENMREDFIMGVDISTLVEMEALGQVYYDGQEAEDLFLILKDHGVNWIRIRLWNDPYDVSWSYVESPTGDVIEGAIGAGTCDINVALELSERAKEAGMKVLLDFHYSDFWADPGKQYKPDAWADLSGDALEKTLYDYTYETLQTMEEGNCLPDMVQVGNEVNSGLLWPDGRDITSEGAFDLLASGSKAIRDISERYDQEIKVMIHLAEGGDRGMFVEAFDALTEGGLDYDVIGVSYYPYWHGSMTQLQLTLQTLEERYGKEVVVAEMAYGYSDVNGDSLDNIFNSELEAKGGYKASVQGQATYIRDVIATVAGVRNDKGLGVFYWEPAWLTPEGAGWITGAGNGWENQCLFDVQGRVLDSLDVFYAVGLEADQDQLVTFESFEPLEYIINQGQKVSLPYRIKALYSDHRYVEMTVNWDNISPGYNDNPGLYTVEGLVEDLDTKVVAHIEVLESNNIFDIGGYEEGFGDGWEFDEEIVKLGKKGENPFTGYYALNFWNAADFSTKVTYKMDIENKNYDVSVWVMGSSLGTTNSYLYADNGQETFKMKIEMTGYGDWRKYIIEDVPVIDGYLSFGLILDEAAGSWGWVDDFELSPQ